MEEEVDPYRGATELWMDCEGGYCCRQAQAVMDSLVAQREEVEAHRDQLIADGMAALQAWEELRGMYEGAFREMSAEAESMRQSVQVLQNDRARLERAVLVLGPIVLATAEQWAGLDTNSVDEAMGVFLRVQEDMGVRGE